MKIHILGVCGTFMASIAVIAKSLGHSVSGSDDNVFPPMSTLLESEGVRIFPTDDCALQSLNVDLVIIGNAKGRGDPNVEHVLRTGLAYTSGPAWLAEAILRHRWVLTVAGTHGKTTTSAMLAWILEFAGLQPGFLIGGLPRNFAVSGRVGQSPYFVIEGDEYDTAFFDKRSKCILYHSKTAIINNIEFDHADIFENLNAVKKQFHHFVKTIPDNGLIVSNGGDANVKDVLAQGCWTPQQSFAAADSNWQAKLINDDGGCFAVLEAGKTLATVSWDLLGQHNVNNALAAIAAAKHAGVDPLVAIDALQHFKNVKRRLEVRGVENNITVYDDFAHHPTEIATTIAGLRRKVGKQRIIAIIEFVSNSMKNGVHKATLAPAFAEADLIFCRQPEWEIASLFAAEGREITVCQNVEEILQALDGLLQPHDHIIIMSNKGFGNIYERILNGIRDKITDSTT